MGGERLEIREDILKLVTSKEAERVIRHLSLFYLRLVRAPHHLWESENVLRLSGELREGQSVSAFDQLISLVKVSPGTARKALSWLHSRRIIVFYTTSDRGEIIITFEGLSYRRRGR
jgi:hypothetical protein